MEKEVSWSGNVETCVEPICSSHRALDAKSYIIWQFIVTIIFSVTDTLGSLTYPSSSIGA